MVETNREVNIHEREDHVLISSTFTETDVDAYTNLREARNKLFLITDRKSIISAGTAIVGFATIVGGLITSGLGIREVAEHANSDHASTIAAGVALVMVGISAMKDSLRSDEVYNSQVAQLNEVVRYEDENESQAEELEQRRNELRKSLVEAVSAVEGVELIAEVGKLEEGDSRFIYIITDGYDDLGERVPNVVNVLDGLRHSSEERKLIGPTPIFPAVGYLEDHAAIIRSSLGDENADVVTELWSKSNTEPTS